MDNATAPPVIPAQAGISAGFGIGEIPACAGMTGVGFGQAFDIITAMTMSESVKEFAPKSAMREEFLALDARMAAMEARFDKRFDRLEARMAQMEGGMKQMEARLEKRIAQSEARQARTMMLAFAGFMGGTILSVAAIVTIIIKILLADPS